MAAQKMMQTSNVDFVASIQTWPRCEETFTYIVLDGAGFERFSDWRSQPGRQVVSLYSGQVEEELAETGLFLVASRDDFGETIQELIGFGWNPFEGVYLESKYSIDELRAHLRKFTVMNLHGYGQVMFALGDPTAVNAFLAAASERQALSFLSKIVSLLLPLRNIEGGFSLQCIMCNRREAPVLHYPLVLESAQVQVIDSHFQHKLCHRITALTREKMPKQTSRMSYKELFAFVGECIDELHYLSILDEGSLIRYVSLSVLARQPLARLDRVQAFLLQDSRDLIPAKLEFLSRHFATRPLGEIPNVWR